jgi:hypothetical protein
MGFFDKLFSKGTSEESVICYICDSPMHEDGEDRYECSNPNCTVVSFRKNGEIISNFEIWHGRKGGTCESCRQSLDRGVFSLPWEDGDNPNAYVKCPNCGHDNIKYGYGGDD